MNKRKLSHFASTLVVTGSILALATIPANSELLVGISFPSQGGEVDETLLTLPKLHLQDAPWFGPENRIWPGDPTLKFSTTFTQFRTYYLHQYSLHQDTLFTNRVFPSHSYSLLPGKFDRDGRSSTGLNLREQLPPQPLSRSVSAKGTPNSSTVSDSSISGSVSVTGLQPAAGVLIATLNQNILKLDWPADHIGWTLQIQTSSPDNPTNSQWLPVIGSSTTNHLTLALDRVNSCVLFRLVAP